MFTVLRVFVAMSLGMLLRRVLVMTVRFERVPMRHLVVMGGLMMIACLVSLMGFMVVMSCRFVMLRCMRMMIMLHVASSLCKEIE